MSESVPTSVRILDREYRIACPEDEQQALRESAGYLDRQMREIRDQGGIVGLDRIAVIAALNIANEFLGADRREKALDEGVGERVSRMRRRVDETLERYDD